MYSRCPKCGHAPLPPDQAFPAACAGCGVIFAKIGQLARRPAAAATREAAQADGEDGEEHSRWTGLLLQVPERVDVLRFWARAALMLGFAVWGWVLIGLDYRDGEIGASFIHRPLLVFHEAGHVLLMPFGEWMTVFGGTLAQLAMPLVLGGALLLKNRDPFGAAIGLWLFGVSLLDVAPYVYDALHPQLMLLSGSTGEEGGHDWIYLLSSLGLLPKAHLLGALVHKLGAGVLVGALAWAGWLLRLQHARIDGDVLRE